MNNVWKSSIKCFLKEYTQKATTTKIKSKILLTYSETMSLNHCLSNSWPNAFNTHQRHTVQHSAGIYVCVSFVTWFIVNAIPILSMCDEAILRFNIILIHTWWSLTVMDVEHGLTFAWLPLYFCSHIRPNSHVCSHACSLRRRRRRHRQRVLQQQTYQNSIGKISGWIPLNFFFCQFAFDVMGVDVRVWRDWLRIAMLLETGMCLCVYSVVYYYFTDFIFL